MKKAFTLAEILLCVVILGIIAAIMIANLRTDSFTEKSYIAQAYKVLDNFEQASIKIRDIEKTSCPIGAFMANVAGGWEFALVNASGADANSSEVLNLYSNYLKLDEVGINFCDYTKYCEKEAEAANLANAADIEIIGAKIPGNAYIGLEVTGITNCPDFYLPESDTIKTGEGKCWGKIYLDADGVNGPNELGKDVFVFGLNEAGVVR